MDAQTSFFLGILLSGGLGVAAAAYLRGRLRPILVDLCGNEARADFWLAFTNLALVGVALLGAVFILPDTGLNPTTAQVASQLRWALAGLLFTLAACGKAIADFIPRGGGGVYR